MSIENRNLLKKVLNSLFFIFMNDVYLNWKVRKYESFVHEQLTPDLQSALETRNQILEELEN